VDCHWPSTFDARHEGLNFNWASIFRLAGKGSGMQHGLHALASMFSYLLQMKFGYPDILSFQLLGQGLQDFLNFGKNYPSKCYESRDLGDSFAFGAYYLRCWSVQLVQTSEMD